MLFLCRFKNEKIKMKKIILLLALFVASLSYGQVVINELDADQESTDTTEFIELKSDVPNFSLDGFIVVLFNGSSAMNESYRDAIDLSGFTTDVNGFFIIGSDAVTGVDIPLGLNNTIQNGADAVAIYQADASSFPNNTIPTTTNLIDALVYGVNDDDDLDLLAALDETVQYDEDANGNSEFESIQRAPNGSYCVGAPTLRAANINCAVVCPLQVTVDSVTCDAVTGGTDTYTTTLSFTGGGTEDYTITTTIGTIGGDNPGTAASGTITITGVDEDVDFTYTITSATCSIVNMINSPSCVPASNVNSIADLRAAVVGQTYTLTSEAILTFQTSLRNQKWIEDATGAIVIVDFDGIITTAYNEGDGITGISGILDSFSGLLQFRPDADPGAATSTDNPITPQVITMTQFESNFVDYESELISFTGVTYTAGDGTATFAENMNYQINDASGSTFHRTNFSADYIGQLLPEGSIASYVAIGSNFNNTTQVLVRRASDIMLTLGTEDNVLETLSIYPNPSNTGYVNIASQVAGNMDIVVYDVLGKQVINTTIANNRLNIAALKSGVYIMKISQGNDSTTKKLVVK